jgi:hypothetical protein
MSDEAVTIADRMESVPRLPRNHGVRLANQTLRTVAKRVTVKNVSKRDSAAWAGGGWDEPRDETQNRERSTGRGTRGKRKEIEKIGFSPFSFFGTVVSENLVGALFETRFYFVNHLRRESKTLCRLFSLGVSQSMRTCTRKSAE